MAPYGVWLTTVEPGSIKTGISARRTKYIAEDSPHAKPFREDAQDPRRQRARGHRTGAGRPHHRATRSRRTPPTRCTPSAATPPPCSRCDVHSPAASSRASYAWSAGSTASAAAASTADRGHGPAAAARRHDLPQSPLGAAGGRLVAWLAGGLADGGDRARRRVWLGRAACAGSPPLPRPPSSASTWPSTGSRRAVAAPRHAASPTGSGSRRRRLHTGPRRGRRPRRDRRQPGVGPEQSRPRPARWTTAPR